MSQAGREIHKSPPHMPQVGSSHFPSLLTHWPLEGAGHTDGHTDVSLSSMGATTQLTHCAWVKSLPGQITESQGRV